MASVAKQFLSRKPALSLEHLTVEDLTGIVNRFSGGMVVIMVPWRRNGK
jgi:hypothetical protein